MLHGSSRLLPRPYKQLVGRGDRMCIVLDWDERGLLPPIFPGTLPTERDRSPYKVSICTFVENLAINRQRISILGKFLKFREFLFNSEIRDGIQWINGSFCEYVELTQNRYPNDIDVVTFFNIPNGFTQVDLLSKNQKLFDHEYVKENFSVDSYFCVFGNTENEYSRRDVTYWYSMWSHTRDYQWKGFIEIPLDYSSDKEAQAILEKIARGS